MLVGVEKSAKQNEAAERRDVSSAVNLASYKSTHGKLTHYVFKATRLIQTEGNIESLSNSI